MKNEGSKNLPEFNGIAKKAYFGAAAGLGVATLLGAELIQSGGSSFLFEINRWLAQATSAIGWGHFPFYGAALAVLVIGMAITFALRPQSFSGAVLRGVGVAAVIATIMPSGIWRPLPSGMVHELSQQDIARQVASAGGAPSFTGYNIRLRIELPNGVASSATASDLVASGALQGRLYDQETGRRYDLFKTTGAEVLVGQKVIVVSARLPNDAPQGGLAARIEAAGYRVIESRFDAKTGMNADWTIKLQPSRTPLFLQRFTRSYWF